MRGDLFDAPRLRGVALEQQATTRAKHSRRLLQCATDHIQPVFAAIESSAGFVFQLRTPGPQPGGGEVWQVGGDEIGRHRAAQQVASPHGNARRKPLRRDVGLCHPNRTRIHVDRGHANSWNGFGDGDGDGTAAGPQIDDAPGLWMIA